MKDGEDDKEREGMRVMSTHGGDVIAVYCSGQGGNQGEDGEDSENRSDGRRLCESISVGDRGGEAADLGLSRVGKYAE